MFQRGSATYLLIILAFISTVMISLFLYNSLPRLNLTHDADKPALSQSNRVKIYRDNEFGYQISYPNSWDYIAIQDKDSSYQSRVVFTPEPMDRRIDLEGLPGIIIQIMRVNGCSDAQSYANQELQLYTRNRDLYKDLAIRPMVRNDLTIGYIIDRGAPGATAQQGSEAYIFNCPYELQISSNPTRIIDADSVFSEILDSLKTWKVIE
jgi:hypothetical protein